MASELWRPSRPHCATIYCIFSGCCNGIINKSLPVGRTGLLWRHRQSAYLLLHIVLDCMVLDQWIGSILGEIDYLYTFFFFFLLSIAKGCDDDTWLGTSQEMAWVVRGEKKTKTYGRMTRNVKPATHVMAPDKGSRQKRKQPDPTNQPLDKKREKEKKIQKTTKRNPGPVDQQDKDLYRSCAFRPVLSQQQQCPFIIWLLPFFSRLRLRE